MGKAKSKITNWSSYNKALVNRGSITFWIDDKATDAWFCTERHGGKGRSNIFSDIAIETALTVKGVFSLLLRATEGFLNSVFQLMGIACVSPGYSCLSKRARVAQIKYKRASRGEVAHVVIDSTGIKTFGEGEWHVLFFYDPDGNLLEFNEHGAGKQDPHDFEWNTVNMDELVE